MPSRSRPGGCVRRERCREPVRGAARSGDATPLVGREEEVELLLRRWQRAKSGEGQVVLLSGEPGIGKSRLTAALQERIADEPHTRLRYFCSPHHQDSALHPIIAQLERAAGFERDDTPETQAGQAGGAARRRPAAGRGRGAAGRAAVVADRRPLPAARTSRPQRKKEQTFEALLRQLEAWRDNGRC